MDMLINSQIVHLKLIKYYLNENKEEAISNEEDIFIDLDKCRDGFLGSEVFEFYEYEKAELELVKSANSCEVNIECYFDESERIDLDNKNNFTKKLMQNEKILISPGGDDDDMLVPGRYEIKITNGKQIYYGFYFIKASTTTWDSLVNMREYIEKSVKGLSYDIFGKRKAGNFEVDTKIMDKLLYLNDKKNLLITSLDLIVKNPITSIEKVYKCTHKSQRPTNKSQRWMNQKGYRYNDNIYNPSVFREKRSIESKYILENRILKKISIEIYSVVLDILSQLKIEKNRLSKKLEDVNASYREYEKDIANINEYIASMEKIKSNMVFYLRNSWLNDLDESLNCIPTSNIIKNKYYNEIYEIYKHLKDLSKDNKKTLFPHKKTSKLFEIYNFLVIKEMFENDGFEWREGWIKDRNLDFVFWGDLKPEDYVVLVKENYKVKITYDKILNRSKDLAKNKDPKSQISVKQNNRSKRPDILIELFKDEKFINAVVVEVKYRKLKYIHSDNDDTHVDMQLENYRDLEYYDANTSKVKRMFPIAKVIVVYPEQKNAVKMSNETYDNIVFLPIDVEQVDELEKEIFEVVRESFS